MRIAVLTRRFNPAGGGTERDLVVTCKCLERAGHNITVYAAKLRGPSSGLKTRQTPILPFGRTLELLCFAYLAPIQARRNGADILISFGRTVDAELQRCGGGVYRSYLIAAQQWRGIHGARIMRLTPYRQLQAYIESRGFASPCLKLALAVSRSVRDDLIATFKLPQDKVATLYNGVDIERFQPVRNADAKRELRRQFGLPESTPVIAFAGNGFARKGLELLLRAWPRLEGQPWLAIAGADRDLRAFKRLADRLGLTSRVAFLGAVRDIAQLYQAVDALALPTLFEAFGNVVLEAMASGIPVLTSAWAGVAELIPEPLRQFLVNNPLDLGELAGKLQALLAASPKAGAAAREAAQEFTWKHYEARLLELIETCRKP
jgi:UDP-glucose:(heptosyl)LPS alpha-1,3-glucosyltransferase